MKLGLWTQLRSLENWRPQVEENFRKLDRLGAYEENTWAPALTGFTIVLGGGTVTVTGTYIRLGQQITVNIVIVPAGGATIASVGAVSAITLPFPPTTGFSGSWILVDVSAAGGLLVFPSFIYPTTWAATTQPILLTATYFI